MNCSSKWRWTFRVSILDPKCDFSTHTSISLCILHLKNLTFLDFLQRFLHNICKSFILGTLMKTILLQSSFSTPLPSTPVGTRILKRLWTNIGTTFEHRWLVRRLSLAYLYRWIVAKESFLSSFGSQCSIIHNQFTLVFPVSQLDICFIRRLKMLKIYHKGSIFIANVWRYKIFLLKHQHLRQTLLFCSFWTISPLIELLNAQASHRVRGFLPPARLIYLLLRTLFFDYSHRIFLRRFSHIIFKVTIWRFCGIITLVEELSDTLQLH